MGYFKFSVALTGAALCLIMCAMVPGFSPGITAQPWYSKAIDLGSYERIRRFIIIDDHIYASTGQVCPGGDCTTLVKMDLEGNVMDQRLFDWFDIGDKDYLITDDSLIVMSGHNGWNDDARYLLQFCDIELDSIKSNKYTDDQELARRSNLSITLFDEWYVLVGFGRPVNENNLWPGLIYWISKHSLELDTVMTFEINGYSTDFSKVYVDKYGFLNVHYTHLTSGIGRKRGILRFNEFKEVTSIWETPFKFTSIIPENMLFIENDSIVVILELDHVPVDFDVELMFMSYDGQYLFSSVLSTTIYESMEIGQLRLARNGDILGCGNIRVVNPDSLDDIIERAGYIFRMAPDGELLWERIIYELDSINHEPRSGVFHDMHELPNGDLILGGFIHAGYSPGTDRDLWLVRTDSMGCITPGCDRVQILTSTADRQPQGNDRYPFKVYPNPVRDLIYIEIPDEFVHRSLRLTLHDVSGRVYQNQKSEHEKIVVMNIDGFYPGLYLLTIHHDGKEIGAVKVILD